MRIAAGLTKNFIVSSRYLPHVAMVLLLLMVMVSNRHNRLTAEASSAEFITVSPDIQYNVAQATDKYTDLIPDDAGNVERATIASLSVEGFVSNMGSVYTPDTKATMAEPLPDNTNKTVNYVIGVGDTLTGIGYKFDVKIASLQYVNNILNIDSIKPGDTIKIPPKNYEVSAAALAKKEQELRNKQATSSTKYRTTTVKYAAGSKYNGYPYGYCTYYVATVRRVPANWGDAKRWLYSARNSGYATGSTPAAGAIVVTSESWWGHVAFVESVNGNSITISEMNARGWGVVSRRTISAYGGVVRGYIY
jgi:surface antigen